MVNAHLAARILALFLMLIVLPENLELLVSFVLHAR
jgi:hypothetical protein